MHLKRTWFALGIALLSLQGLPGSAQAQERDPAPEPQIVGSIPALGVPLPSFQWQTLAGERFSSEDLPGQRTVMVLWSPDCPHSRAIVGELPGLLSMVSGAGARFILVDIDSSRVEAREALAGAVPEGQVVFATRTAEVLTHPQADQGIEGPVIKAVMVPSFLVIDESGIVQVSKLWSDVESFAEEVGGPGTPAGL